jgi:hypothetical protein
LAHVAQPDRLGVLLGRGVREISRQPCRQRCWEPEQDAEATTSLALIPSRSSWLSGAGRQS